MTEEPAGEKRGLIRGLGPWDAALVTIGSVLGTGIFITTGDMARAMPHAGLLLLAWLAGGLLTLAGALTYAELGALFPRTGGQYLILKTAYGKPVGFLYCWALLTVIQSGAIGIIAIIFIQYAVALVGHECFESDAPVCADAAIFHLAFIQELNERGPRDVQHVRRLLRGEFHVIGDRRCWCCRFHCWFRVLLQS